MTEQDNIIFLKSLKWAKDCKICKKPIKEGEQCWWFKPEKSYAHINCYKKDNIKKLVKTPIADMAIKAIESQENEIKDIEKTVSERLRKARDIVNNDFPEAKDYVDYINLIVEICHELFAEESTIRIQLNKEALIEKARR